MKLLCVAATLAAMATQAMAQRVLFSFDELNPYRSLPVDSSVGGINAHLSATGQGFSIQLYGSVGLAPRGMGGNYIFPNSVYAADLLISYSVPLRYVSIMYAPEEYGCDTSARMRITAYDGNTLVGTATTTTYAGTWPTGVLVFSSPTPFTRVVVHYDAPPPTGGDWGPIFIADNMVVSPNQADTIVPSSYSLIQGDEFNGGIDAFKYSDDVKEQVFNDPASLEAEVEVVGVTAFKTPASITINAETCAARYGLAEVWRAYDYSLGQWRTVFGQVAEVTDLQNSVTWTTNAAHFVNGAGQTKMRFKWSPINDEAPTQDGWLHEIDFMEWQLDG